MAEKTEKPTNKRRKDSAKKGQTFKSKDLVITVILLTGSYFLAHSIDFSEFTSFYIMVLKYNFKIDTNIFLHELVRIFFMLSIPFILFCSIIGFAATMLQTKFSFATEAIKLNFKALNPIEGIKKIFTMRTIKELVKSVLYFIVFLCTCHSLVYHDLKKVISLYHGDIVTLCKYGIILIERTVFFFIGWAVFVLVADFLAEYFLHFKDLKMDKHEVKQEYKESEGNPQIKSARRSAHQDILSGEEKAAIRSSEVVMANPTHIAMAIYFKPEVASLPFIALRCTNQKAKAAFAYAETLGIPVVRNVALTRRLYRTYSQYNFISINDDSLMDIMNILIWLKQVEVAGMALPVNDERDRPDGSDQGLGSSSDFS